METALMAWERKILGNTYGPTHENGSWKIKMNQEIYNKFKCPDIVTVVTVRRLEWIGHVARMDGKTTVKKLLEGKSGGKGKKRKTWVKVEG
jgi:hypothetical protein